MTDLTLKLQPGDALTVHLLGEAGDTPPPEPEPDHDWPNKPAGFTEVNEWNCAGAPAVPEHGEPYVDEPIPGSDGWRCVYNHVPGATWPNDGSSYAGSPYGFVECVDDAHAPSSPSAVYRFSYPEGMKEGIAPATAYLSWGGALGVRKLYAGMWWKPSANFDLTNGVGTKIAFMFNGGGGAGGQAFCILDPGRHVCVMPEYLPTDDPAHPYYQRSPNRDQTPVELGAWHQLEWYMDLDGHVIRWWIDGRLTGDYADLVPNAWAFDMFQLSPTYGGCCSHSRPATCDYQFDHAIVAAPPTVRRPRFGKLPPGYRLPELRPWPW